MHIWLWQRTRGPCQVVATGKTCQKLWYDFLLQHQLGTILECEAYQRRAVSSGYPLGSGLPSCFFVNCLVPSSCSDWTHSLTAPILFSVALMRAACWGWTIKRGDVCREPLFYTGFMVAYFAIDFRAACSLKTFFLSLTASTVGMFKPTQDCLPCVQNNFPVVYFLHLLLPIQRHTGR